MGKTTINFHVIHHGEPAAGFLPYSLRVDVTVHEAFPSQEERGYFVEAMREALQEHYEGARAWTEEEYRKADA